MPISHTIVMQINILHEKYKYEMKKTMSNNTYIFSFYKHLSIIHSSKLYTIKYFTTKYNTLMILRAIHSPYHPLIINIIIEVVVRHTSNQETEPESE